MIKKVFFLMAAITLLTYSCTGSEEEIQNTPTQTYISLNPNVASTRAAMMDLDSLKNDPDGFRVYAYSNGSTSWYNDGLNSIDGTNNHVFETATGWGFQSSVLWPAATTVSMTFMAYYPSVISTTTLTGVSALPPPSSALTLDFAIPSSKFHQIDILVAKETVSSKPASGELLLTFKHILSKVNIIVSTSDGTTPISDPDHKVYVLAVGFCNLISTNSFDALSGDWWPSPTTTSSYDYFNSFEQLSAPDIYPEKEFSNATEASFFSDDKFEHLMLLPQEPAEWDLSGDPANDAYIRMLYRVENPSYTDSIGYASAENHPSHGLGISSWDWYEGPLYLLVGYAYKTEWKPGEAYEYNIPILPGSKGGILLDKRFYDNQGNPTDLEFNGNLWEHVTKLTPYVKDWDYKASTEVID